MPFAHLGAHLFKRRARGQRRTFAIDQRAHGSLHQRPAVRGGHPVRSQGKERIAIQINDLYAVEHLLTRAITG